MAKNLFNTVPVKQQKRNVFDLTHDVKLTLDMGNLVPVMIQECVPGDSFTIGGQCLLRFAPLVAPVMHRMDVTIHYFFCPSRIVYPEWEGFIVGDGSTPPEGPTIDYTTTEYDQYPLLDYLGLPRKSTGTVEGINAIPFAVYQKIWYEYYRDQNLSQGSLFELEPGPQTGGYQAGLFTMRRRCWQHDYFTAALPFAQKGDPVQIPIGNIEEQLVRWNSINSTDTEITWNTTGAPGGNTIPVNTQGVDNATLLPNSLFTEGTTVDPTTINDLRRAFRLQEWLENNARGGTRYIESILSHFGVKSSDARLNRPQYITGIKTPAVISEVLNTTGETDGLPQGNMAGHAIAVGGDNKFRSFFCEEHGYIMGIMSVMPVPAYQQGIPRHFLRSQVLDYYWPEFANIGEQEVFNKELYVDHSTPDGTFGYVPRYAEYKYTPSRVAGDFKTSLDFWHLGRIFATAPNLNSAFVEFDPAASKRIFAVTDPNENSLYAQVLNRVVAVRPMPKYGVPSF